jgi:hypothetical protein
VRDCTVPFDRCSNSGFGVTLSDQIGRAETARLRFSSSIEVETKIQTQGNFQRHLTFVDKYPQPASLSRLIRGAWEQKPDREKCCGFLELTGEASASEQNMHASESRLDAKWLSTKNTFGWGN